MSHWKLFIVAACLSLCLAESASADPWGRYNRGYYRPYAAPVYVRPPVIVPLRTRMLAVRMLLARMLAVRTPLVRKLAVHRQDRKWR